jgi:hypothetical protein
LAGEDRRLESLASVGQSDLASAPEESIRLVFDGCSNYFRRRPYRRWFDVLEKVLCPLGASYYAGTACHLDLVQWATDPTWQKLQRHHKSSLIADDLAFLSQQLSDENIELLLLNGSGIAQAYSEGFGCVFSQRVFPGPQPVRLFVGTSLNRTKVIGWNKNLQSSFGVSNEYIRAVVVATAEARVGG